MKRKSDFFDIDPIFNSLDELIPIAENTINAAIAESNGHISRDQLQIAIIAGLSAFISTLGHGGAFDQGEKAAITIGKSLPHIIVAANKVNKEYANPKDRIFHMLRTAAGLLSHAATSTLSGFLPEKRADIGKDIEIPILLVSSYANKKRKMKGSGKINITPSFEIGVSWLNPSSGYTGGGIFDTFRDWLNGTAAKREELEQMQQPMPGQTLTSGDVDPLGQLNLTNSIIPDPDAPGLLDKFNNVRVLTSALSTGANIAAGAATGNPMFWVNAVAGSLPIINALLPIAGGLGSKILKHTYGTWIRDRVAANPNRWPRYSALIRNVDSFTNDVSNWWNTKEQKKLRKQLMLTAETMVPAIAQDYMYNKQRKAAWDANVERERTKYKYEKAVHDAKEADDKAEVDRANAVLAEDIRMERRKLEVKNSNILANEAQDMADYEDMVKHNDITNVIRDLNADASRKAEIVKLRYQTEKDLTKMSDDVINGLIKGVASVVTASPSGAVQGFASAITSSSLGKTRTQLEDTLYYYNRALEENNAGNYEKARKYLEQGLDTQLSANKAIEKTLDHEMDKKWDIFAKKYNLSNEDLGTIRDITELGEEGNRLIDELVFKRSYDPKKMYELKQELKNADPQQRERLLTSYKIATQPQDTIDFVWDKAREYLDSLHNTGQPYIPPYLIPERVGPVKRVRFQETYPLPNEIVNKTDPRLHPYKTHVEYPEFVEPAPPVDLYGMPYTQKAIAELPNILRVYGNDEDDVKKIYHHDLQYVSPMKKTDVNPGPHNYKSATPLRTIPIIHQKRLTQFKPFTPSGLTFLKSAPSAIPRVNLKRVPRVNLKRSRTFSRKT